MAFWILPDAGGEALLGDVRDRPAATF